MLVLAEIFGIVPLQLKESETPEDYDEILRMVRARAQRLGGARWLDNEIQTASRLGLAHDSRQQLHRLLHTALVAVRAEAHQERRLEGRPVEVERTEALNERLFYLAHIFHNVPLKLLSASEERRSYDNVLNSIREGAKGWNYSEWLDDALRRAAQLASKADG